VIVTAGRGNTNAMSGSLVAMIVPAAPARRGPVPLLPLGQRRIFPLCDSPARSSGWQELQKRGDGTSEP
jgi:hypothetical protein